MMSDSPEEAFIELSNDAMTGGSWDYTYEELDERGAKQVD